MALSNIRKEPRREIVETLLGLIAIGGFFWLDYIIAASVYATERKPGTGDLAMLMFVIPASTLLCIFAAYGGLKLVHATGELIADALAKRGLELRPRKRY